MRTRLMIGLVVLACIFASLSVLAGLMVWLGALRGIALGVIAAGVAIGAYLTVIGPRQRRWGATDQEVRRTMPGDEFLRPDAPSTTRGITIDAAPETVFPWLLQIGYGRGGWYSYDWIDNDGKPSVARIEPPMQRLAVGDRIEMMPGVGPVVREIEPNHHIVSGSQSDSWCLLLEPTHDGRTRLISRWRQDWPKTAATYVWTALADPGAFLMEQRMLRTIRDLAEQQRPGATEVTSKAESRDKEGSRCAAVIQQFGRPLVIEDRPVPEPGRGQIRVKIETSGVCHTDIHAANGDWPIRPTLPLIPGHEGVGLVDALGYDVDRVSLGQRVAIPWLGSADGTCEFCVKGLETYCVSPTFTGYTVDGGYREYSIADASFVGLVPEGVDPLDAAPLTCAGVTTYKAVKAAKVGPSDLVGIVGIGGLGHLGLQYAAIAGAFTVAIDVSEEKLQLAKELGADHTINAAELDVVAEMQKLGGADAIISTAATPKPLSQAFSSLRSAGRLVLVGLPAENVFPLPIFETVLRGIQVIGSLVGTREDLAEVFALHAGGRTRVVLEARELKAVNDCFQEVLDGVVPARLVMDLR